MNEDILHLRAALAELGEYEPDQIAGILRSEGIKGHEHNGRCCPVANWLKKHGFDEPIVWPESARLDGIAQRIDVPQSVHDFILKFDRREYPDLLEA